MTTLSLRLGEQDVEDRGDGPALLWLGSCFAEAPWLPVHEMLAASHRVIVPAAPTLGEGRPLQQIDGVEDYVLHLLDILDALGVERAAVVGTSFGGWMAGELAAFRPDLVSALVVIGPMGLRVEGQPIPELFTMTPGKLARALLHDPKAADPAALPAFDRAGDPVAAYQRLIEGQEAMARLGWTPYLHDPKLPLRLRRYSGPALVLWGDDDQLSGPGHAAAWAELLGTPAELVEDAGHLAAVEQPERVAALVEAFLEPQWSRSRTAPET